MTHDEVVINAYKVRERWLAGEITYGETRALLSDFIKHYNSRSEEIAKKYNQKPKKLRLGDFLKFGVGPVR